MDLKAVYLFGSHARGSGDTRPNLHLLVVTGIYLVLLKRIRLVLELLRTPHGLWRPWCPPQRNWSKGRSCLSYGDSKGGCAPLLG